MAMFVLVVDTSLMNVSISAVVRDLGTTVSGVQSAIALEALVSAAFILIGGKVGDLIGRKRAYLGVFVYLIARGHKMQEHALARAQAQDSAIRDYVRNVTGSSGSPAEELARLAELRDRARSGDAGCSSSSRRR